MRSTFLVMNQASGPRRSVSPYCNLSLIHFQRNLHVILDVSLIPIPAVFVCMCVFFFFFCFLHTHSRIKVSPCLQLLMLAENDQTALVVHLFPHTRPPLPITASRRLHQGGSARQQLQHHTHWSSARPDASSPTAGKPRAARLGEARLGTVWHAPIFLKATSATPYMHCHWCDCHNITHYLSEENCESCSKKMEYHFTSTFCEGATSLLGYAS